MVKLAKKMGVIAFFMIVYFASAQPIFAADTTINSAETSIKLSQSFAVGRTKEESVRLLKKARNKVPLNTLVNKGQSVSLGTRVVCFNKNNKPVKCPDKITIRK